MFFALSLCSEPLEIRQEEIDVALLVGNSRLRIGRRGLTDADQPMAATYVQLDGFSCRCGRGFGRITRSGSRKSEDGLLISLRFPYSHGSLSGKISYLCTID